MIRRLPDFERNAWLYLASMIIGGVSFSIYQLYFNLYILSLGFDKGFLGFLASIPSGVILVLGLPLGVLADRIGRRTSLLLGNVGMTLATFILVGAASPAMMVAGVALLGVSQAVSLLSSGPFMMMVSKDSTRTTLFSAQFGLTTLAGFAGSLLGGQLPRWLAGSLGIGLESPEAYRAVIGLSAMLTLVSVIPLWLIREMPEGWRVSSPKIGMDQLWRQLTRPLALKLIAPNIFIGFGAAILIPYMNVFFKERFLLPDDQLGLLFSLAAVTTGVATLYGPKLAERFGKVRSVVFTQAASLVFMMLIGFGPGLLVAAVSFLIRGALMNLGGPLYQAFSMEQVPDGERATLNSAQTLMWEIGWTFGPALSGFVQQRYGFAPLFVATTVFYAIGALLTYAFFNKMEVKLPNVAPAR